MLRIFLLTTVALLFNPVFNPELRAQDEADSDTAAAPPESVIVRAVESYVAAFNNRDAEAVSQHWSESGLFVDADGNRIRGRENVRQAIESMFAELADDQALTVSINRVAFVTDDVAVEEGTSRLGDEPPTEYLAIHRREQGVWNIYSVKEHARPVQPARSEHLHELGWMIGHWVDRSGEATVDSSCYWSKNGNFITRNFRVSVPGMESLEGTQVIGYDASTETIRSWMFDSDGGTASGQWMQVGDSWEVQTTHVLADGRRGSAYNIFTPLARDQFQWRSVKRSIDGETLPDVPPVDVYRVPDVEAAPK